MSRISKFLTSADSKLESFQEFVIRSMKFKFFYIVLALALVGVVLRILW